MHQSKEPRKLLLQSNCLQVNICLPKSPGIIFIEWLKQPSFLFPVDQNFIKLFFNAPWLCLLCIYIAQPCPLSLIKVAHALSTFLCSAAKVGKNQGTLIHLWNCQSIITWILILREIVTFPGWACQLCWQRALYLIECDVCTGSDEVCQWCISFLSHCLCSRGEWYSIVYWPNSMCFVLLLQYFFT